MDDIIILAQTKNQFVAARKKLFRILRELKLKLSTAKTRMGKFHEGFHFLGVQFDVPQSLQTQTQEAAVKIHSRSCRRALERIRAMKEDAVYSAEIQRYLRRWALVGAHRCSADCGQSPSGLEIVYRSL